MNQNISTDAKSDTEISDLEFVEELISSDMLGRAEHDTAVPHRV